jgi:hypothetical protein
MSDLRCVLVYLGSSRRRRSLRAVLDRWQREVMENFRSTYRALSNWSIAVCVLCNFREGSLQEVVALLWRGIVWKRTGKD